MDNCCIMLYHCRQFMDGNSWLFESLDVLGESHRIDVLRTPSMPHTKVFLRKVPGNFHVAENAFNEYSFLKKDLMIDDILS